MLGYVALYGVFLSRNPFALVMLALGSLAAWIIQRSNRKADEEIFSLATYKATDARPSVRAIDLLRDETIRLWVLVWRASSEAFLKNKVLPENSEVRTRRVILDTLASLNLRDSLSSEELDLHLLPDGDWNNESISTVICRRAELEALQYACGAITLLSPIEDFDRLPRMDFGPLSELAQRSAWKPRETYDIRREREMAASFYVRCLAEQEHRGIRAVFENEEGKMILDEARANAGSENTDLLIGTEIVSEVGDDRLRLATGQAWLRLTALGHALSILEGTSEANSGVAPCQSCTA